MKRKQREQTVRVSTRLSNAAIQSLGANSQSTPAVLERGEGSTSQTGAVTNEQQVSNEQRVSNEQSEEDEPALTVPVFRGPSTLDAIWNLPDNERIVVKFNSIGAPVGYEGGRLTRWLGTAVRKSCHMPINYDSWNVVPKAIKDKFWNEELKKRFVIPAHREAQIYKQLMKNMNSLWKNYKCELRCKYFDPILKTREEMISVVPPRANSDQWASCVNKWLEPKQLDTQAKNKLIRFGQKNTHHGGSKSYARLGEELKEGDEGNVATRSKVYIAANTPKNGVEVSDYTKEKLLKLNEILTQNPENEESLVNKEDIAWSNTDAFSQVFGKEHSGRVRGVGIGPVPSQDSVNVPSGLQGLHMTSDPDYNSHNEELKELKVRFAAMEALLATFMASQSAVGTNEATIRVTPSNNNLQTHNGSTESSSPSTSQGN